MKEYAVRKRVDRALERGFNPFKTLNRFAPFKPPPLVLPRVLRQAQDDRPGDEGGGLNGAKRLSDLNGLNEKTDRSV